MVVSVHSVPMSGSDSGTAPGWNRKTLDPLMSSSSSPLATWNAVTPPSTSRYADSRAMSGGGHAINVIANPSNDSVPSTSAW